MLKPVSGAAPTVYGIVPDDATVSAGAASPAVSQSGNAVIVTPTSSTTGQVAVHTASATVDMTVPAATGQPQAGGRRSARPKVLGYKHAPGQAAAQAAARARSYMRRAATIKVDQALVKKFGLLRQALTANVSSESTVAAAMSGLVDLGATQGANPSQAGETTVGPAKDDVWLVPGSSGACLVDVESPHGAGSGCNSTSAVDAGDLWTLDTIPYRAGRARTKVLLGAVPDGNASVTVSWAEGSTTVIPVTDNIYSVPIGSHKGWKSVTLKNSAGTVVAVPGMPSLPSSQSLLRPK